MINNLPFVNVISKLKENGYFKRRVLNPWDTLIKEGEVDSNIYIVIDWSLSINKIINHKTRKTNTLALVWKFSILWEQSINNPLWAKRNTIKAEKTTEVIYIDCKKDFSLFNKDFPDFSMTLMSEIIKVSNERLNNLNEEMAYVFEFNNFIKSVVWWNIDDFRKVLHKIDTIIPSNYIIFLKKHHILDDTFVCKYDTRYKDKTPNIVIEKENWIINLFEAFNELGISDREELSINKINIWDEEMWYILCWRDKWSKYTENEKKILKSFATSISSLVKQMDIAEDTRNRILLNTNIDF